MLPVSSVGKGPCPVKGSTECSMVTFKLIAEPAIKFCPTKSNVTIALAIATAPSIV